MNISWPSTLSFSFICSAIVLLDIQKVPVTKDAKMNEVWILLRESLIFMYHLLACYLKIWICFYFLNILTKCSNETIQSFPKRSIFGHFQPHSVSELTCHMFHQNKEIRSTDCFLEKEILSTILSFLGPVSFSPMWFSMAKSQ